eukprot:scaffold604081_cov17-Prasinocladus_malaysianus.AAC.1
MIVQGCCWVYPNGICMHESAGFPGAAMIFKQTRISMLFPPPAFVAQAECHVLHVMISAQQTGNALAE